MSSHEEKVTNHKEKFWDHEKKFWYHEEMGKKRGRAERIRIAAHEDATCDHEDEAALISLTIANSRNAGINN